MSHSQLWVPQNNQEWLLGFSGEILALLKPEKALHFTKTNFSFPVETTWHIWHFRS